MGSNQPKGKIGWYGQKDSPQLRARLLSYIAQGLTISGAARLCKLHPMTVAAWKRKDEDFAAKMAEAEVEGNDFLEDEARRRAVVGVTRPVYQGKELVGHVQEYSDRLLEVLLKGRRPEKYRDNVNVTGDVSHRHQSAAKPPKPLDQMNDAELHQFFSDAASQPPARKPSMN